MRLLLLFVDYIGGILLMSCKKLSLSSISHPSSSSSDSSITCTGIPWRPVPVSADALFSAYSDVFELIPFEKRVLTFGVDFIEFLDFFATSFIRSALFPKFWVGHSGGQNTSTLSFAVPPYYYWSYSGKTISRSWEHVFS